MCRTIKVQRSIKVKRRKQYFYMLLICIIFVFQEVFSAQIDYQYNYKQLTEGINSHNNRASTINQFFHKFEGKERVAALVEISKLGNADFIAYELFSNIQNSIQTDTLFRRELYKSIQNPNISDEYKIVAIDFCNKDFKNIAEAEQFDSLIYRIAVHKDNSMLLRNFALSQLSNHFSASNKNREKIKNLLTQNDLSTIKGASLAARTAIRSIDSQEEINTWVPLLINIVESTKTKPSFAKAAINALGVTKSDEAKRFLHMFFKEQVKIGSQNVGPALNALKNFVNEDIIKDIFILFSEHSPKFPDPFEIELMQKYFAKANRNLLVQLSKKNDYNSKLAFLLAQQVLKYDYNKSDIDRTKHLLSDSNELIRLQAVKALRFMLTNDEEIKLFSTIREKETSQLVLNEIFFYIGSTK